jgi:hypothetical protein
MPSYTLTIDCGDEDEDSHQFFTPNFLNLNLNITQDSSTGIQMA